MTASERVANWRKDNPEKAKQQRARYRERRKEHRKTVAAEYRRKNKLRIKEYSRLRYLRNKGKILAANRAWSIQNPEKHNLIRKADRVNTMKRFHSDINFRLITVMRNRIKHFITHGNGKRRCKSSELLGAPMAEVKGHIEARFKPGMTWENYTYKGWHIDHVVPCSSFDLTDLEQQKKCFHYTNLQPLWWHENLAKGAKFYQS